MPETINPSPNNSIETGNERALPEWFDFDELSHDPTPIRTTERVGLSAEIISQNQALYDALLGEEAPNIQELYDSGEIITPWKEQQAEIEKEGYSFPVIILPEFSRQEVVGNVRRYFKDRYKKQNSPGVYFFDFTEDDYLRTTRPPRPNQPYLCYLRADREVNDARPELKMEKSFSNYTRILAELSKEIPLLGLEGTILDEYLLAQVAADLQGYHFNATKWRWTWLLGEQILDAGGRPARCLYTYWNASYVFVDSGGTSIAYPLGGPRLAAVASKAYLGIPLSSYLPQTSEENKNALSRIKRVFGNDVLNACKRDDDERSHEPRQDWRTLYARFSYPRTKDGKSMLDALEKSGRGEELSHRIFARFFGVRPASASQEEGRGSLVSPVSPDNPQNIDTANLVRPVDEPDNKEP